MQKFLILVLCVAATTAASVKSVSPFAASEAKVIAPSGVVSPVNRCGGVGTFLQLRVSDCVGVCSLRPGTVYDIECDMVPSSAAPSLILLVQATVFGTDITILEVTLPNSSVQPGQQYTLRYNITPNDILSGQNVIITSTVSRSIPSHITELCVQINVNIL